MSQVLAREFLRALRGSRSRVTFSRRLGYASNVAAQWESGRRMPTALAVLLACRRLGIDVAATLTRFHSPTAPLLEELTSSALAAWLAAHLGRSSITELSQASGLTRYQVSRILRGQSSPRLPECFQFVSALTGRLPDFIAAFVPIEMVPSAREDYRQAQRSKTLAADHPWSAAVMTLLETAEYRNTPHSTIDFLADHLPVSRDALKSCIEHLESAGICTAEPTGGAQKHRLLRALTIHLGGKDALHLRKFWAEAAFARAVSPGPGDLLSYNIMSLSERDFERARKLQLDFFRQLRTLVVESRPSEAAGLVVWHFIRWNRRT